MTGTSVLVADDHPALLAAVTSYLEAHGIAIIGPARDGAQARTLADAHEPELALVDWRMPRVGGAELIRDLIAAVPKMRVVVYTGEGDHGLAQEALAAGAAAVLLKEAPLADVLRALEAVRRGHSYLDPALRSGGGGKTLTTREVEVLTLLAQGLRHEEIGERLGIGAETVRTHVRKASDRLGATTRTQAVAIALRQGFIL